MLYCPTEDTLFEHRLSESLLRMNMTSLNVFARLLKATAEYFRFSPARRQNSGTAACVK